MLTMARRLVQIWLDDEQHFADLQTLRLRMNRARNYLSREGCNQVLGRAVLERARFGYKENRDRLRANRREAWALVAGLNHMMTRPLIPCFLDSTFPKNESWSWDLRGRRLDGWCA